MRDNIEQLLKNDCERKKIAFMGNKTASDYSRDKAYLKFKKTILS